MNRAHNQKRMLFLPANKSDAMHLNTYILCSLKLSARYKWQLLEFTKQYFVGFFCCGPPSRIFMYMRQQRTDALRLCYSCYTCTHYNILLKCFSRRKSIEKKKLKKARKSEWFSGVAYNENVLAGAAGFHDVRALAKKYVGRSTFNFYAIFNRYICVRCCLCAA